MLQVKFPQTRQEQLEVMEWLSNRGPVTKAVQEATTRYGLTFGAALTTRKWSHLFAQN